MSLQTPVGPAFFIFFQVDAAAGGGGMPDIEELIYQELSQKTVKKLAKKVKKYQKAQALPQDRIISKESINAIVDTMVDTWPKAEMLERMESYDLNEYNAILAYKNTLKSLFDDDLALILILASI